MRTLSYFRHGFLSILMLLTATVLHAQADLNVNKDGGGGGWYTNPIVWVIGAAVFILLLVALLRGGKK